MAEPVPCEAFSIYIPKCLERSKAPEGVLDDNYGLVFWDMATTGKRQMDEVFRTITEAAALTGFIGWLEKLKEDYGFASFLLINHASTHGVSVQLLSFLTRHSITPRFADIVAGFTDTYSLCQYKCKNLKDFSIRSLSRELLSEHINQNHYPSESAQQVCKVMKHLSEGVPMIELARCWAYSLVSIINLMHEYNHMLIRQNSFGVIFEKYFRNEPARRKRLVYLRGLLVDAGLNLQDIKRVWIHRRTTGIQELLTQSVMTTSQAEFEELLNILKVGLKVILPHLADDLDDELPNPDVQPGPSNDPYYLPGPSNEAPGAAVAEEYDPSSFVASFLHYYPK